MIRTALLAVALLALFVALVGCGNTSTTTPMTMAPTNTTPPVQVGPCGSAAPATFELTFTGTWNGTTHAGNFPSGAHFSAPVGGTHRTQDIIWVRNGVNVATNGIEVMAEQGGTATLLAEIDGYIASGDAGVKIVAAGGTSAAGSVSVQFTATMDHPLLSIVSMVAPSPDWFVGVANFDLCQGGTWIDDVTIDLNPVYDAGTDNGASFTDDIDQTPHFPIRLVSDEGTHFTTPHPPIATLRIRRIS